MIIAKVASWSIRESALGFTNFKKRSLICYLLGCWALHFGLVLHVLSIQKPVLYSPEEVVSNAFQWGAPGQPLGFIAYVPSAEQLSSKVGINITRSFRNSWPQNTKTLIEVSQ